jgi:hypothetical protein
MDAMVIGTDASKDWPDVAVRPTGQSLIFKRRGAGIEDLMARHSEPYHRRWLRSRLPAAAVSTALPTLGAALDAAFAAYISRNCDSLIK